MSTVRANLHAEDSPERQFVVELDAPKRFLRRSSCLPRIRSNADIPCADHVVVVESIINGSEQLVAQKRDRCDSAEDVMIIRQMETVELYRTWIAEHGICSIMSSGVVNAIGPPRQVMYEVLLSVEHGAIIVGYSVTVQALFNRYAPSLDCHRQSPSRR